MNTMEQLKEFVNPEIMEKIDKAADILLRLEKIHTRMIQLEEVQGTMQERQINQWSLRLEINHMTAINFHEKDVLKSEVWEAIGQFMSLLESIHYSERKQAIIDFNNSLKDSNDGENTEK